MIDTRADSMVYWNHPLACSIQCRLPVAPATASAQRVEDTFFNSVIPSRVDHLIGFTPTTFAMYPRGQRIVPITVRVGGRKYRYNSAMPPRLWARQPTST